MVDRISKEKRSKIMSAIRSKNTRPEVAVRKALWAKGFRFRIHYGKEKIDIAFPSKKIAIFVDGCFWHGCPLHFRPPKSNKQYWYPKLEKNVQRAKEKDERLLKQEWKILHFWEHEIINVEKVVKKIEYEYSKR